MNRKQLEDLRRSLITFGLVGVLISTSGCEVSKSKSVTYNSSNDSSVSYLEKEIPLKYSRPNSYYSIAVRDGNNVKLYKTNNICLFIDKDTYDVRSYLYNNNVSVFGGLELYDLESEKMLVYLDGICINYNIEYYKYLINNCYRVYFSDLDEYIDNYVPDLCYSLEDIENIENKVVDKLKETENFKIKVRIKNYKLGENI